MALQHAANAAPKAVLVTGENPKWQELAGEALFPLVKNIFGYRAYAIIGEILKTALVQEVQVYMTDFDQFVNVIVQTAKPVQSTKAIKTKKVAQKVKEVEIDVSAPVEAEKVTEAESEELDTSVSTEITQKSEEGARGFFMAWAQSLETE